jgi:excisionase family DNA binding protein
MIDENYCTVSEAAKTIGCSENHVRLLVKQGKLRGDKITERLWLVEKKHVAETAKKPGKTGRPRGVRPKA